MSSNKIVLQLYAAVYTVRQSAYEAFVAGVAIIDGSLYGTVLFTASDDEDVDVTGIRVCDQYGWSDFAFVPSQMPLAVLAGLCNKKVKAGQPSLGPS